ncbi:MAG: hypothetical protein ISS48_02905 [Candidatus Aenigmarchaeota archaeon]|nr:hypothetical protein [Candidatus Aenigmarchaeota archaeon]
MPGRKKLVYLHSDPPRTFNLSDSRYDVRTRYCETIIDVGRALHDSPYDAIILHELWPQQLNGFSQIADQVPLVIVTIISGHQKQRARFSDVLRGYDPDLVRFLESPCLSSEVLKALDELLEEN